MIIETNDAYIIYKFADKFKNVNIEKLEDAIIKLKSCKYIYEFAKKYGCHLNFYYQIGM